MGSEFSPVLAGECVIGIRYQFKAVQKGSQLQVNYLKFLPSLKLVGLGGLEPPTFALSGQRSNQLSYRPMR